MPRRRLASEVTASAAARGAWRPTTPERISSSRPLSSSKLHHASPAAILGAVRYLGVWRVCRDHLRTRARSLGRMKTSRLRVTLRGVVPPVVRVIDVPASSTLPELHELLQAAVGWTDSHLHQFVVGEATYGVPSDEDWGDQRDERIVRLRNLPARFDYLYDFGDGWEHDVEVLGPGDGQPGCRYGEGACPPEECGGPVGYAELLEVLADPTHEEHADLRAWAGSWRTSTRQPPICLFGTPLGRCRPVCACCSTWSHRA